jgi:hypothetical protein
MILFNQYLCKNEKFLFFLLLPFLLEPKKNKKIRDGGQEAALLLCLPAGPLACLPSCLLSPPACMPHRPILHASFPSFFRSKTFFPHSALVCRLRTMWISYGQASFTHFLGSTILQVASCLFNLVYNTVHIYIPRRVDLFLVI